jgi:hypothetical protein
MRTLAFLLVLAVAGCQTTSEQVPMPPLGCYARIPQHGEVVDLNVTPEKSLTDHLVQLIPEGDWDVQHCWFSTPKKNLKLVAGDACRPHSEYEFQWKAGAWVLSISRREEFVQCHYRR